ncbi:hypothetical protein Hanom_Chr12g01107591 [Helianthus anomalus]
MSVECSGASRFKQVMGFGDSGSPGRVSGTITESRWVLKTKFLTEGEYSPMNCLQNVESGSNS